MSENSPARNKEAIFLALQQVPHGSVISYGQLARLAGLPGAARLAGHVLRDLPQETRLPWHRVVNSEGKISLPPSSPSYMEQVSRLTEEGVEINNGRINLKRFGFAQLSIAPLKSTTNAY